MTGKQTTYQEKKSRNVSLVQVEAKVGVTAPQATEHLEPLGVGRDGKEPPERLLREDVFLNKYYARSLQMQCMDF